MTSTSFNTRECQHAIVSAFLWLFSSLTPQSTTLEMRPSPHFLTHLSSSLGVMCSQPPPSFRLAAQCVLRFNVCPSAHHAAMEQIQDINSPSYTCSVYMTALYFFPFLFFFLFFPSSCRVCVYGFNGWASSPFPV